MARFDDIVIATDLDGTFFGAHGAPIVKRNLDAVRYFTENGGSFTIATGRAAMHVTATFPQVADYVNIPAIVCNGACLHDYAAGKLVSGHPLDFGAVRGVVELIHREFPEAGVRANSAKYAYLCTPRDAENPYVQSDIRYYAGVPHSVLPIEAWGDSPIYKFVVRADADVVERIVPVIKERFSESIDVATSSPTIIDMQVQGHDKGTALRDVVRRFVGADARVYACGDFFNDVKMLRAADVSVCPSNAHGEIKKICDLCLCSNEEGLIAELIERIDAEL